MSNSDESSVELPARRDDEPESLRVDIIDELTDHLLCAFNRELHIGTTDPESESAARQRALSRFGNPTTIARRLWYDAMKDRIMSQRLTTTAAIVMACACLAMFVLVWRSIGAQQNFMTTQQQHIDALTLQMQEDADEAVRQREQLQELLADSQQLNRELTETGVRAWATENTLQETHAVITALTERLSEMEERTAAETSDWNPVELQLVQGTVDGPPAVGFSVQMRITTPETGIPSNTGVSDETGIVRFERVRYGAYDVFITAPWQEYCYRQVLLQPGESYSDTVVCPMAEPEPLVAELAVAWPEDLAGQPIFMKVNPTQAMRVAGSDVWSNSRTNAESRRAFRGRDLDVWVAPSGVIHRESTPIAWQTDSLFVPSSVEDEAVRAMRWPGADYRTPQVEFYVPLLGVDRMRFENGEPFTAETPLKYLCNLRSERNELTWRLEEGTPNRIVLLPAPETAEEIREELALLEAGGSREEERQREQFASFGGGRIDRLPELLMGSDLTIETP